MAGITVLDRTAVSDQDFYQLLDALKNATRDLNTALCQGKTLKVGDVDGGNYFEIEADGTFVLHGDATTYDDFTFPMSAYKLESVVGTLQYNYTNASITMNASGTIGDDEDTLVFVVQVPHGVMADSSMDIHIHWEQPADQAYTFDVQYAIQSNGEAKNTSWSTLATVGMVNNIYEYESGTLIQITDLIDVDLTGIAISSLIKFRLTRSDATAGDIEALAVDCHFKSDRLGSRTEYTP